MKNQAFQISGVTTKEYVDWCREHDMPVYRQKSKQKFFALIRTNRLCRDSITGKLVSKRAKGK